MPTTYALMGATGATGSAILRHLLVKPPPDVTLNIYVRNKPKLLQIFPDLETQNGLPIKIHEGSNTDVALLKTCLENAQVIFMCVAVNSAKKGDTLFTDTAAAMTSALQALQAEQKAAYRTPSLLILRAVPLNPAFASTTHSFGARVMWFILEHVYSNMIAANEHYERSAETHPGLLVCIYLDPPAIHDAGGTQATGYELLLGPRDGMGHVCSFADLGVAFCEVAERRAEFAGKGIVVLATGEVNLTWGANVYALVLNMRARLLGF